MCNPISAIVTKEKVWFGTTDSHEDIIREHKLREGNADGTRVYIVRVEVTPPNGDLTAPVDRWVYRVDQDVFPVWYDAEDCETRARGALERSGIGALWTAYNAVVAPAGAAYYAAVAPARAAYDAAVASAWAAYDAVAVPAGAAYDAAVASAGAAYDAAVAPARAAYDAARHDAASTEY